VFNAAVLENGAGEMPRNGVTRVSEFGREEIRRGKGLAFNKGAGSCVSESARLLTLTPGTLRLKTQRLKDRRERAQQHTEAKWGLKGNLGKLLCNYGGVRFKYMTAMPEAMHGVKLKIENKE